MAQQPIPAINDEWVIQLSERFNRMFADLKDPGGLFAPDTLFDLNVPVWRFQIVGPDAFVQQLNSLAKGEIEVDILRTVPTVGGFITEHVEHTRAEGKHFMARRIWLCTVANGVITEVVGYCSGEWDEALIERHEVEAPMVTT